MGAGQGLHRSSCTGTHMLSLAQLNLFYFMERMHNTCVRSLKGGLLLSHQSLWCTVTFCSDSVTK